MNHNIQPTNLGTYTTINQKVLDNIMTLPDNVRKQIRLLAKQYNILSVHRDPPNTSSRMQRQQPYIITYDNPGDPKEFTWPIKSE